MHIFHYYCNFLVWRQPWTEEERNQLKVFFKDNWGACPSKRKIDEYKRVYDCAREWTKIKSYVRYMYKEKKPKE